MILTGLPRRNDDKMLRYRLGSYLRGNEKKVKEFLEMGPGGKLLHFPRGGRSGYIKTASISLFGFNTYFYEIKLLQLQQSNTNLVIVGKLKPVSFYTAIRGG